jgi:hypothetical protein
VNIFGNWLNDVDSSFKLLIRVGVIVVVWSLWLCRNDKVFNNKKCFSYAGYLPVHNYALFAVASTACGVSRPIYECVKMIGGYRG